MFRALVTLQAGSAYKTLDDISGPALSAMGDLYEVLESAPGWRYILAGMSGQWSPEYLYSHTEYLYSTGHYQVSDRVIGVKI